MRPLGDMGQTVIVVYEAIYAILKQVQAKTHFEKSSISLSSHHNGIEGENASNGYIIILLSDYFVKMEYLHLFKIRKGNNNER